MKLGSEDSNRGDECIEEDALEHLPEMVIGGRVFYEEGNDKFVVVARGPL
jgi:hypothetical protein